VDLPDVKMMSLLAVVCEVNRCTHDGAEEWPQLSWLLHELAHLMRSSKRKRVRRETAFSGPDEVVRAWYEVVGGSVTFTKGTVCVTCSVRGKIAPGSGWVGAVRATKGFGGSAWIGVVPASIAAVPSGAAPSGAAPSGAAPSGAAASDAPSFFFQNTPH